ncbi:MAG: hypothetical protein OXR66_07870 [Candidatus Woesearchaeota archaeon]|nr:hypothetical protein [Candidatus Woesearchaeota archaeon]
MDELLQEGRWAMIAAICNGADSTTAVARATGTSLPNVSQHMQLLHAYDIVAVEKEKQPVGKPRHKYTMKKPICHVHLARNGFAGKQFLTGTYHETLLNVLFLPKKDQAFVHKLLLCYEDLLDCAIGYVKSSEKEIELVVLTENLEKIRAEYANLEIAHMKKKRRIVNWAHSVAEVREGLAQHDPHFVTLFKQPHVLHDPTNTFEEIQ